MIGTTQNSWIESCEPGDFIGGRLDFFALSLELSAGGSVGDWNLGRSCASPTHF